MCLALGEEPRQREGRTKGTTGDGSGRDDLGQLSPSGIRIHVLGTCAAGGCSSASRGRHGWALGDGSSSVNPLRGGEMTDLRLQRGPFCFPLVIFHWVLGVKEKKEKKKVVPEQNIL